MRPLLALAVLLLSSIAWADFAPHPAQFCEGKSVGEACYYGDRSRPGPGTCQEGPCYYNSKQGGTCIHCVRNPQDLYAMPTGINWLAAAAGPVVLLGLLAHWLIQRRRRASGAGLSP